uniref:Uncharacterized protein n=1 Tax=Noccaea caerulescens TaxID=107243 RepID=A0A1J3FCI3_NOCCA
MLKLPLFLRFRRTTRSKRQRLREHTIVPDSIVGMRARGDAKRRPGRKCVTELVEVAVPSVTVCRREPPVTQHHVLATPLSVLMAISSSVLKTFKTLLLYALIFYLFYVSSFVSLCELIFINVFIIIQL